MWNLVCCFSILMIPVGLGLTLYGVVRVIGCTIDTRRNITRRNWQTTTGEIVAAEVHGPVLSFDPGFTVALDYHYKVDDRLYSGSRIRDGRITGYRLEMENLIKYEYPIGQTVTVYYNPHRPRRSLLELRHYAPGELVRRGINGVIGLVVGLVLSVIIPFLWLYSIALALSD